MLPGTAAKSDLPVDPTDPVALARALIRAPSVTPDAEPAMARVAELLTAAGYHVERLDFSDHGPRVANLYARIGTEGPNLCFAGHVDVVPPGDAGEWRHDPFSGALADGLLYGRGAVDMKGAVAASIAAAVRFGAPPAGSLSFLITGDEEGPALDGTVRVVEALKARGEKVDACILGEPTNPAAMGDAFKIGRRGSLSGVLTVEGKQGHVAYPHLADNPIPRLLRLLGALTAAPLDEGSEFFPPSNLEVISVDVGNPVFNLIPAKAEARFNVRFNDHFTLASLEAEIRRRLDATGLAHRLAFRPGASQSFRTEPGPFVEMVRAAVAAVTGRVPEASTSGGTSDARFIKDLCPVIEFGLVGRTMHQVDEACPVDDIVALTAIYERIIQSFFAR
ncbi:succinyl-diaminopimelate desuccinylase [Xanthobacter tagetidis]|uniref:Succinyl-diaminopimelate desuccinylase n=1 Tax=Xanthobacter tagetidis TaxID=60216 RepID=A0A3L7AHH0_9HYPH|nr:succinyl-diaminopimelate desuccinylase [Xanthobacter tagetidis]MBB6306538.1 succinyl-diaminopimelate desuccinylase [Xanthobacter tagetidis]RLP79128.1 succinyl-diaminopimelate desuccinylase [Xanthobacter tagetidis]